MKRVFVEIFHHWRPDTRFMRICLAFVDTFGGGVNCQQNHKHLLNY